MGGSDPRRFRPLNLDSNAVRQRSLDSLQVDYSAGSNRTFLAARSPSIAATHLASFHYSKKHKKRATSHSPGHTANCAHKASSDDSCGGSCGRCAACVAYTNGGVVRG